MTEPVTVFIISICISIRLCHFPFLDNIVCSKAAAQYQRGRPFKNKRKRTTGRFFRSLWKNPIATAARKTTRIALSIDACASCPSLSSRRITHGRLCNAPFLETLSCHCLCLSRPSPKEQVPKEYMKDVSELDIWR